MPYTKNIEITVSSLAYGGRFVGQITSPIELSGKKTFIPYVMPGEEVTAKIIREHSRYIEAELISINKKNSKRQDPPCPYFTNCGGCDLQHMSIQDQRDIKLLMVKGMLEKQAGLSPQAGFFSVGKNLPGLGYRNRIRLHQNTAGRLGFFRPQTGEIVEIDRCLIASDSINRAFKDTAPVVQKFCKFIRALTIEEKTTGIYLLWEIDPQLTFTENVKLDLEKDPALRNLATKYNLILKHRKQTFDNFYPPEQQSSSSVGSFSQVNNAANQILVEIVATEISSKDVLDLYAGSGNFSFPIASQGARVTAVEVDSKLVKLANELVLKKGLDQVQFVQQSCEKYVVKHKLPECIILDPPRSGAKEVVKAINSDDTKQIIYISCNLPTFCRDLKTLHSRGFKLDKTYLLDMFPQTHHVETINILTAN